MKQKKNRNFRTCATLVALAAATWFGGVAANPLLADPSTNAPAASEGAIQAATSSPAKIVHKLTGAELYSIHCNRCHPERYPTERTAATWKTIMLHMQVRAQIPVAQARLILKYLQDNSGR